MSTCTDCQKEYEALLCDLPSAWRTEIACLLCKAVADKYVLKCSDVKSCETLTSLSAFSLNELEVGFELCITYKDEKGVSVERCIDLSELSSGITNIFSTGLTDTSHTITADLSTGKAGGQTAVGGTGAGDDLTLSSTTNGTKGDIIAEDKFIAMDKVVIDSLAGSGSSELLQIDNLGEISAGPKVLHGSDTLDFGNTSTLTSADLTIALPGVVAGDAVMLGVPNGSVNANTCYTAWVSSNDVVTVRFNNYSSGSVNPASGVFKVAVLHFV